MFTQIYIFIYILSMQFSNHFQIKSFIKYSSTQHRCCLSLGSLDELNAENVHSYYQVLNGARHMTETR